jgi:hypothetical protein
MLLLFFFIFFFFFEKGRESRFPSLSFLILSRGVGWDWEGKGREVK